MTNSRAKEKRWRLGFATICIGAVFALTAATAHAGPEDDWVTIDRLATQYQRTFMSQSDFQKRGQEFLDEWSAWCQEFTPFITAFKENYGESYDEVNGAFEGVRKPAEASQELFQAFLAVKDVDVEQDKKKFAGWAESLGSEAYQRWSAFSSPAPEKMELKVDYAERAVRYYTLAQELAGGYESHLEKAKAAVDETRPAWLDMLGDLKWPGHEPEFAGPGDPDELAAAALDWLADPENHWSAPEYDDEHIPIAACVEGKDWEVYKKEPITGTPRQWSLDFLVAFEGTKDPDIAYVYHMVLCTKEETGVEKGLPFRYGNSRQYAKFRMLMDNIPRMRGKGGGGAGGGASSSSLLRWVLSLGLILAGLVAAESGLTPRVPQLAPVCAALNKVRGRLGIGLLIIGLLAFLRAFLSHFAPFTDLLPHATAILLGLVLGKEILLRKSAPAARESTPSESEPAGEEAPAEGAAEQMKEKALEATHKAQELLEKNKDKIESLSQKAVPLGYLGLASGILHLLLGGAWLL